ncbi:ice-binding family protein [Methyloferula stellata]|uniref:ice-binding family protein n=1 Tax=Methyloferula stellata TaxID=876270 RepID=UPI001268E039|nr:ice-binding family protein [Methyloferula stellata]
MTATCAALGLMMIAAPSARAQAPSLGTAGSFGVLAGSTVTNTGSSVINGNVGVWPGTTVIGFPPGIVTAPSTISAGNAVAQQAQLDNMTAYNQLAATPITVNLSGQDLGGKNLVAGVYGFNNAAQLTGTLVLNGQGNPNSVFIFNINSTLTTASASSILLINGAQANHVFFRVGSSATLGTSTSFEGDILALTSITLDTGATIICGDALAQNGAVTLDSNTITVCTAAGGAGGSVLAGLPANATANERAVAIAIDNFLRNGGTLPSAFVNLIAFSSPAQLAAAFDQLSGEAGTGTAQAGTQAMNSFLSLVMNPFAGDNRPFSETPVRRPLIIKGPLPAAPAGPEPSRWGVWAAGYGGQGQGYGDVAGVGSHDRSVSNAGSVVGLDYLVLPNTVAGFALGGGGTRFGLSDALGGGHSDMAQAAVYASTRINAAYLSGALAYAWSRATTDRYVSLTEVDHLTANFSTNNIGGRIEGGYRFALPYVGLPGRMGFIPYAAVQAQSFFTPAYSEGATLGLPTFALSYASQTITTTRTELGAWFDWATPGDYGTTLVLRTRAAWANDHWSRPSTNAMFETLPGSNFSVIGAAPPRDSALTSLEAEVWFKSGFSIAVRFDGEFAENAQRYTGLGVLRYVW